MNYCKECGREMASDSVISNFYDYRTAEASTDEYGFIKKAVKSNKIIIAATYAIVIILFCLSAVNGDLAQQFNGYSSSNISQVNMDSDYLLKEGK